MGWRIGGKQAQSVVTCDHRDACLQAFGRKGRLHRPPSALWIQPACVADEALAACLHQRPQAQQHGHHVSRITQRGVALAVFVQDGQGELGQMVAGHIVQVAAFHRRNDWFPGIAIKAQTCADVHAFTD